MRRQWPYVGGRRRVRATILACLGLLLLGISACSSERGQATTTGSGSEDPTSDSPAEATQTAEAAANEVDLDFEPVSLTFGLSGGSIPNQMPYTAVDGGFMQNYGIDAEVVVIGTSATAMSALLSGDAEFVFGARSEGVLTRAADQPVLYALKHSSGFLTGVTVSNEVADSLGEDPKNLPLADRLRALEGKTVALTSEGSVLTLVFKQAMDEHGFSFEPTYMEGTAMSAALSQGNVDAYMFPSPFQEGTESRGEGIVLIEGSELPISGGETILQGPMYITEDYLAQNRDVVVRVIAGFLEAAEWTRDNSEEARDLAHERFSDLDPELFDLVWERAHPQLIGPLEHPLTVNDIEFIIENDTEDNADAQALDAADMLVPEDVIADAWELVEARRAAA